jgi:hypothetical protein
MRHLVDLRQFFLIRSRLFIPTPVTTHKDADDDPILLPISDDDSVDSSLYSRDSESEGGFWDNQYNDDVSIAPEGARANSIR